MNTTSIAEKEFKVHVEDLGDPNGVNFLSTVPSLLGGIELNKIVNWWRTARRDGKHIAVMYGGHLIKSGTGVFLAELVRSGYISSLHANGAAVIHDVELSLFGETSEDVNTTLVDGTFGFGQQEVTSEIINSSISDSVTWGESFYCTLSRRLIKQGVDFEGSPLLAAYYKRIPFTMHSAFGADFPNMTLVDSTSLGEVMLNDFNTLVSCFSNLTNGSLLLNIGSAVILPEVALKSVAKLRNKDPNFGGFNSVNLDMRAMYRSETQLGRFALLGGDYASLIGQHEILLPLLWHILKGN